MRSELLVHGPEVPSKLLTRVGHICSVLPPRLSPPSLQYVVKKATEFGAVETWMNERVRRACPNACADFVYGFYDVSYNLISSHFMSS